MILVYFIYGLSFFSLGLAVLCAGSRSSRLPLGRQLPWLAAFGICHSLVEWIDMLLLANPSGAPVQALVILRSILLPFSAILLLRFGAGLIIEVGQLPAWTVYLPVALFIPAGLVLGYAITIAATQPPLVIATEIWSRYLVYFPASLLAAFGMLHQARNLPELRASHARSYLLCMAATFFLNALVAGLIVPKASYGLAAWINYDTLLRATGIPVQIWRMASAVSLTIFVLRALTIFEAERASHLAELASQHQAAQSALLQSQLGARQMAEAWCERLVDINRQIAGMQDIELVLNKITQATRLLLNADVAAIGLCSENSELLEVKCIMASSPALELSVHSTTCPHVLKSVRDRCSLRFPQDMSGPEKSWSCPISKVEIKAAAVAPLKIDNQPVGALWVYRLDDRPFSEADVTGLERLADQGVIALSHVFMQARLQSIAVLEERSRIAREMHDGLAQILGYLHLELQTLKALTLNNQQADILAEIDQISENVKSAQADVRDNILSLRTTLSSEEGVLESLKKYFDELSIQTNIEIQFVCSLEGDLGLTPLAETQMIRIIQEALANVRKHAQAECVQVRMARRDQCLTVSITDDGVGFLLPSAKGHYGLATMKERAESVGGGLTVDSQPQIGTLVELWLPVAAQRPASLPKSLVPEPVNFNHH